MPRTTTSTPKNTAAEIAYPVRLAVAVGGYARGTVFTQDPKKPQVLAQLQGWVRAGIAQHDPIPKPTPDAD